MRQPTDSIAHHYDTSIYQAELVRLPQRSPIEWEITKRWLARLLPSSSIVADIGTGSGLYAEFLLGRGSQVHLVDISRGLLQFAAQRLAGPNLLGATCASAVEVLELSTASFDAVLLLGPLYHLLRIEDRRRALAEAARILKPNGLIFAAAINRSAFLRERWRRSPERAATDTEFFKSFWEHGNLDPNQDQIGYAHLTLASEHRLLCLAQFDEEAFVGVESFAGSLQSTWHEASPEARAVWLDVIEQTAASPEGLGQSEHFLFIGRKRAQT
jgi:SAM-dependent methyltransferase